MILFDARLRNLRLLRSLRAATGMESKKLNERSSSTRFVRSEKTEVNLIHGTAQRLYSCLSSSSSGFDSQHFPDLSFVLMLLRFIDSIPQPVKYLNLLIDPHLVQFCTEKRNNLSFILKFGETWVHELYACRSLGSQFVSILAPST